MPSNNFYDRFSANSLMVLEKRYLRRNEKGKIIETPEQMFRRVAEAVAEGDEQYGGDEAEITATAEKFFGMMADLDWLPNSPCLMNAGTEINQLAACFCLPIEDSMESIFEAIKSAALIHKSGGGTGFDFSQIRPKDDIVQSTGGIASGPVSFMHVFNAATEVVKQGSRRRGANMGVLRVDHPDIMEFISCKEEEGTLSNFNISVGITKSFMDALSKDEDYSLINPRTSAPAGRLRASEVMQRIAEMAWRNGEPGLIFLDRINEFNPTPALGQIKSVNPCVIGSTLIAVADGRDYVTIKQLAEEGKDIPVYCYGENKIQIRMGHKPRLTRLQVEVSKVTLDDGSTIIATPDHKFLLRDSTEKSLSDLEIGDSLMPFYKFQVQRQKQIWHNTYWDVNLNNGSTNQEQRLVAEFHLGRSLQTEEVVHHRDEKGLNNAWNNLELMAQSKHTSLHQRGDKNVMRDKWWNKLSEEKKQIYREKMSLSVSGEKNGMYGRHHSAETRAKIGEKTSAYMNEEMRRILSEKMKQWYAEHGTECLKGERVKRIEVPCFTCGKILKLSQAEIDTRSSNNKTGEIFCSGICSNRGRVHFGLSSAYKSEDVLNWGFQYKREIGVWPTANGWEKWRKGEDKPRICSRETIRKLFGGFRNFRTQLQEISLQYNHKVVLIEAYGVEDVYNITVDDFHNIAYLTDVKSKTRDAEQPRLSGIITAQCGEQPLLPLESCNLGSVNLSRMITEGKIDWQKLERVTKTAVHFLDNVITINEFPLPEIREATLLTRKIGLGVMGFAEMLIKLGVPYNSLTARGIAARLIEAISYWSKESSCDLAASRGVFPAYQESIYAKGKYIFPLAYLDKAFTWQIEAPKFSWQFLLENRIQNDGLRNATTTTIAPTGSIALIAGTSHGIEPLFALAYRREHILDEDSLMIVNPLFAKVARAKGFYSAGLVREIAEKGSCQGLSQVPKDVQKVFITAHDISPEWHIRIQAAFQTHGLDNAASKTINMPHDATVENVHQAFLLAYKLGCKGITVYRDRSRIKQVLSKGSGAKAVGDEAAKPQPICPTPRPRPDVTRGTTTRVALGCNRRLFITINEDSEGLCEVFVQVGKGGGCVSSFSQATGRLISLALRSSIPAREIIEQLRGIRCPHPSWHEGKPFLSCADAVARSLVQYLGETDVNSSKNPSVDPQLGLLFECPECEGPMEHQGGCSVCRWCGYSECG